MRTKPWLQSTCTENLAKFGRAVFEICVWADIYRYILITVLCTKGMVKKTMSHTHTDVSTTDT